MQLDFLPVILDHLHRLCDTTGGTDQLPSDLRYLQCSLRHLSMWSSSFDAICRNRAVKDVQSLSCLA